LLGLEAAKAVKDMGVKSHIIEFAPILMCRQIDQGGHDALVGTIEEMGLEVHCGARTESFVGQDGSTDMESTSPVAALRFSNEDWDDLPVQMIVVSCGIKPRDDLAREAGLAVGERGGIVVDDQLRASAEGVYAIGEIALHRNFIYGLIAPGMYFVFHFLILWLPFLFPLTTILFSIGNYLIKIRLCSCCSGCRVCGQ
jgi:nitrite reductase (NADH) large subunit